MRTMTVRLRTVTPLFLGGGQAERRGKDESIETEIRVPPIKGALRFWFRFAEGARQAGDVEKVYQEEARLFGSAGEGTGLFRLRLRHCPPITARASQEWSMALGYLGYGPVGFKQGSKPPVCEPKRSFIAPGQEIGFDFLFGPKASEQDKKRIYESLWLWTHLGGFGSRARRGWGSLALEEPTTGFVPEPVVAGDNKQIEKQINDGIRHIIGNGPLPTEAQYSHWFAHARVYCPHVGADGMDAMEWIANKMITFRSNSTRFHGAGPRSQCWADHELLRKYLVKPTTPSGTTNPDYQLPSAAPLRAVFGLPQNYTFSRSTLSDNPSMASVTAVWVDSKGRETELDRRSSPLLLHFHRVSEEHGKYRIAVIVTFVPARFLPAATAHGATKIKFSPQYDPHDPPRGRPRSHTPPEHLVDLPTDWTTIEEFLRTL